MLRLLTCFLAVSLFTSCVKIPEPVKPDVKEEKVDYYDYNKAEAQNLVSAYDKLSQKDCARVYLLFRGSVQYFENVKEGPVLTSDALAIFADVRDSYGWKPDTYKDLTDAIEKYLKEKGFSDPTWTFEDHKLEMINSFNTIAESAKLAWLSKNEPK